MRIHVASPPPRVWMAVQEGKAELLHPSSSDPNGLTFEFTVRVSGLAEGAPNFLGEFAHGPAADRFVYVSSGTEASPALLVRERRAKLRFGLIPASLLKQAIASERAVLEANFHGTAKDGGAVCASLPSTAVEWRVMQDVA